MAKEKENEGLLAERVQATLEKGNAQRFKETIKGSGSVKDKVKKVTEEITRLIKSGPLSSIKDAEGDNLLHILIKEKVGVELCKALIPILVKGGISFDDRNIQKESVRTILYNTYKEYSPESFGEIAIALIDAGMLKVETSLRQQRLKALMNNARAINDKAVHFKILKAAAKYFEGNPPTSKEAIEFIKPYINVSYTNLTPEEKKAFVVFAKQIKLDKDTVMQLLAPKGHGSLLSYACEKEEDKELQEILLEKSVKAGLKNESWSIYGEQYSPVERAFKTKKLNIIESVLKAKGFYSFDNLLFGLKIFLGKETFFKEDFIEFLKTLDKSGELFAVLKIAINNLDELKNDVKVLKAIQGNEKDIGALQGHPKDHVESSNAEEAKKVQKSFVEESIIRFTKAIHKNKLENANHEIRALVSSKLLHTSKDEKGDNLLHILIKEKVNVELCKELIPILVKGGISFDDRNNKGESVRTILYNTYKEYSPDSFGKIAIALIDAGMLENSPGRLGTLMLEARELHNKEVQFKIFEKYPEAAAECFEGNFPTSEEAIEFIKPYINVSYTDLTPGEKKAFVAYAKQINLDKDTVKELLGKGGKGGLLSYACKKEEDKELREILLEKSFEAGLNNNHWSAYFGHTPVEIAFRTKNLNIIESVLKVKGFYNFIDLLSGLKIFLDKETFFKEDFIEYLKTLDKSGELFAVLKIAINNLDELKNDVKVLEAIKEHPQSLDEKDIGTLQELLSKLHDFQEHVDSLNKEEAKKYQLSIEKYEGLIKGFLKGEDIPVIQEFKSEFESVEVFKELYDIVG